MREKKHLLDSGLAGHEHHESIHADTHARCGGHAVFKGADKIVVDDHGLVVAFFRETHLLHEALILVDGVVEFGVGVGQLLAVDHQLEALGELRIVAVSLCKRRHLYGIVDYERRLDVGPLALLAENFVDQFSFAHGLVYLDAHRGGGGAEFVLVLAVDVETGMLEDGVAHSGAAEGGLE